MTLLRERASTVSPKRAVVTIGLCALLTGWDWLLDLSIALNYGQGTGSAQLLRFVTEHTEVRILY
jgi:hypothetical protein